MLTSLLGCHQTTMERRQDHTRKMCITGFVVIAETAPGFLTQQSRALTRDAKLLGAGIVDSSKCDHYSPIAEDGGLDS